MPSPVHLHCPRPPGSGRRHHASSASAARASGPWRAPAHGLGAAGLAVLISVGCSSTRARPAAGVDDSPLVLASVDKWMPALSPDGARLAFVAAVAENQDVWLLDLASGAVGRLTTDPGADTNPSWSPDGARLLFESNRDGNLEIYSILAGGGGIERLTHHPASDAVARWSPDGTRILFQSDRSGSGDLHILEPGGTVTRLIDHPARDEWGSWSPDGTRVVFHTTRFSPTPDEWDIAEVEVETGRVTRLTPRSGHLGVPHYAPDGRRIAFHAERMQPNPANLWDIHLLDPDGGGRLRLTLDPRSDNLWPTWVGADRLLFMSKRVGRSSWEVYLRHLESGHTESLTAELR